MNEESLFAEVLTKKGKARTAFLDEHCQDDMELRQRLEALLRAHDNPDPFLEARTPAALPTMDEPIAERPGAVIGPYKLVEQIGEGGMGTVWMAQQQEPVKRVVALKLIKAGMDSKQVIARFEAERQALALMEHPNIAKVLDGGTVGQTFLSAASPIGRQECLPHIGRPDFVMDLVKGVPITKYCDEHHLTPRQRLELFIPVCQAIQHAHQKGIIHRDLKPSNVLVALYDGKPVPKVIDFGVAKAAGQSLTDKTLVTGFGNIVGTLEYMSPEQAEVNQLDIDTRSDIYSLGVLLYELLTGSTPFTRKELEKAGMLEMLRMIREQEPSKPSTKLSTAEGLPTLAANRGTEPSKLTKLVRGELDWIVMKALEKDRNRRYETANGFAMDVQRYLADETVLACPPSMLYRARKFARRNRGALLIAGFVLFVLVLLGGGAGWIVRERAERQALTEERVNLALQDATELQLQAKWQDALEAAKRAEAILAGGGGEELRARVQVLHKDLVMVLDLEAIRLPRAVRGVEGGYDVNWADAAYAEKFRDYGIDVDALEPGEAAACIRARSIWHELTVALDSWAILRRDLPGVTDASWKRLLAVARAADPDPWRNQIREAIKLQQTEVVRELARSDKVKDLPLETLVLLVDVAGREGTYKEAELMAVLRLAQRKFPGDFWVNFKLAYAYDFAPPPYQQFDEAIRFYTAALAARPRNAPTHMYLGMALLHHGKFEEALARLQCAHELNPEDAACRNTLAWHLATCPKPGFRDPSQAMGLASKAVELAPAKPAYWNTLGVAQYRAGSWHQAIRSLEKAEALAPGRHVAWNAYFLAMAHWQLGEKEPAHKEYERALEWMERNRPKDEELRRFRAEAEELMGVKK